MSEERDKSRAFEAYDPRQARIRLLLSLVAAKLAADRLHDFGWALRVVAGWNALCVTQLALAWWIVVTSGPAETRRRAEADDPGRTVTTILVLAACLVSLFVAMYLLRHAGSLAPRATRSLVVLCLAAVAGSWMLTHTTYTSRYARLYYRRGGGLEFPGEDPPDYWDFAYFAFTIGMCFQVSDVSVVRHAMRRAVLGHSLISFAYNTAILALALNVIAGLAGR
jgi:uncharacterized membrane protein